MSLENYLYIGDVNPTTREAVRRIAQRLIRLEPDHLEVIAEDVEKFADGALAHAADGPFLIERGDWLQHLLEEVIDARFYLRMEQIKRRRVEVREVEPVNDKRESFDLDMHPL